MENLKVGDVVNMRDGSWSFGIKNGNYSSYCPSNKVGDRKNLRIVETGLDTMKHSGDNRSGEYCAICDILVTNDNGGFWFTQSRFLTLVNKKHIIVIDGKEVEIDDKTFQAIKKAMD